MIKLIAADMDGTLLDSQKVLSPELFPIIEKLAERDIKFAVASGRQYFNLLNIFEPIKELVTFIAENGAVVFKDGKNIYSSPIKQSIIPEIVREIRQIKGAYPVLCGVNAAYFEDDDPDLKVNAEMYYHRYNRVKDVLDIDDAICKVAVYDAINAEKNSYEILKKYKSEMGVTISGDHWVDFTNIETSKGTAIETIQEKYGIKYEETMLFGDYLNDYEMMKTGEYSYAMENAHPQLKEISNYTAKSNDENGVVEMLKTCFSL